MSGVISTNWVAALLRQLPRPVLRMLDSWSYRLAQRRARERQERWARRQTDGAPASRS